MFAFCFEDDRQFKRLQRMDKEVIFHYENRKKIEYAQSGKVNSIAIIIKEDTLAQF